MNNRLIIENIYDAFEMGDLSELVGAFSPEIELTQCRELPFGGRFHGHDGARAYFEKALTYLDPHLTIGQVINAGELAVVVGRNFGIARRTGRRFDLPFMHLWAFDEGLAVRLHMTIDVPGVLAALAS